jgi:hypothetical protein
VSTTNPTPEIFQTEVMITVFMELEKGFEQQESVIVCPTSCKFPSFIIRVMKICLVPNLLY